MILFARARKVATLMSPGAMPQSRSPASRAGAIRARPPGPAPLCKMSGALRVGAAEGTRLALDLRQAAGVALNGVRGLSMIVVAARVPAGDQRRRNGARERGVSVG